MLIPNDLNMLWKQKVEPILIYAKPSTYLELIE